MNSSISAKGTPKAGADPRRATPGADLGGQGDGLPRPRRRGNATNTPELVQQIIDAAGEDAARRITEAWGGTRTYFRRQALAELVGEPAAQRIVGAVGPGLMRVPEWEATHRTERDAEIRCAFDGGATISALALRFDVTERRVRQILRAERTGPMAAETPTDYRVLSCLNHDGRTFDAGTRIALPAAAAGLLIAGGVVRAIQPGEPDSEPQAPGRPETAFRGPHHGHDRRSVAAPELGDWLELNDAIAETKHGRLMTDLDVEAQTMLWADAPPHRRSDYFQQARVRLRELRRAAA